MFLHFFSIFSFCPSLTLVFLSLKQSSLSLSLSLFLPPPLSDISLKYFFIFYFSLYFSIYLDFLSFPNIPELYPFLLHFLIFSLYLILCLLSFRILCFLLPFFQFQIVYFTLLSLSLSLSLSLLMEFVLNSFFLFCFIFFENLFTFTFFDLVYFLSFVAYQVLRVI